MSPLLPVISTRFMAGVPLLKFATYRGTRHVLAPGAAGCSRTLQNGSGLPSLRLRGPQAHRSWRRGTSRRCGDRTDLLQPRLEHEDAPEVVLPVAFSLQVVGPH